MIAALPVTATANAAAVTVPVTTWVDTDTYNPAVAGSYTFTATLGAIPAGFANAGAFTATVEVVVASDPGSISNITDNNVLLVGRHAFQLGDASFTLNNYLEAVDNFVYQSGGNYEIYYRAGGKWYNLVAAEGQGLVAAAEVDPGDINGDGLYEYMNMVDVTL